MASGWDQLGDIEDLDADLASEPPPLLPSQTAKEGLHEELRDGRRISRRVLRPFRARH